MRNRLMLIVLALPPVAGMADAATLCRDSKGLFTPCIGTPARPSRDPHHRDGSAPLAAAEGRPPTASAPDRTVSAAPARPARPPLVGRGKLCRDSKGLFKPC